MNITTSDMLNGLRDALALAIPTATVTRKYVEIDDLSVKSGEFPRVMVLLGGGEQRENAYPNMDEDTEVVLVLYVHDETSAEEALLTLFNQVLDGCRPGFDAGGQHYDVIADGGYNTSRQSVNPFGWLVKSVKVFQRFG